MNRYEIEEIISGDSARDEKQETVVCEICADQEMITEATHESHNMEMCYDCWSEVNE
tara:strand:+ start:46 stop:216 length:171 start_codon:yes stop_codon:yes gene_type:complete